MSEPMTVQTALADGLRLTAYEVRVVRNLMELTKPTKGYSTAQFNLAQPAEWRAKPRFLARRKCAEKLFALGILAEFS
jgi:hypothetical protein